MKKLLISLFILVASVVLVTNYASAEYKDEFKKASDLKKYKGFDDVDTANLIKGTTSVIHKENLEILKLLKEIELEISELQKAVKKLQVAR